MQEELDELDRAILAALPDAGEKIGKYLQASVTVLQLKPAVDPAVSSGEYGARMVKLAKRGYVVKLRRSSSNSRGAGWQRTTKGKLAATPESEVRSDAVEEPGKLRA